MAASKDPVHYFAFIDNAQMLSMQMQYGSASNLLLDQVLHPIIALFKSASTERSLASVEGLCRPFCEAFARTAELLVSFSEYAEVEKKIEPIIRNKHLRHVLFTNMHTDVTARLRFAQACAFLAYDQFNDMPSIVGMPPSMYDMMLQIFFNTALNTQEFALNIGLIGTMQMTMKFLQVRLTKKLIQNTQTEITYPHAQLLNIWTLWKAAKFDEEYLQLILCIAYLIVQSVTHQPDQSLPVNFFGDLSQLISQALTQRLYIMSFACYDIAVKYMNNTTVASQQQETRRFEKRILCTLESLPEKNDFFSLCITLRFLREGSPAVGCFAEARRLYERSVQTCLNNKQSDLMPKLPTLSFQILTYNLASTCDVWQDIDLKIETLEKLSTGLESFDQRLTCELALSYLVKGKQFEKDLKENEADEHYKKAEELFSRVEDVEATELDGPEYYQLMTGLFHFARYNYVGALEQLSLCRNTFKRNVSISKFSIFAMPESFKAEVDAYRKLGPLGKVPGELICGVLLVSCYVTLGRDDEAKAAADELWDVVRNSCKTPPPPDFDASLDDIIHGDGEDDEEQDEEDDEEDEEYEDEEEEDENAQHHDEDEEDDGDDEDSDVSEDVGPGFEPAEDEEGESCDHFLFGLLCNLAKQAQNVSSADGEQEDAVDDDDAVIYCDDEDAEDHEYKKSVVNAALSDLIDGDATLQHILEHPLAASTELISHVVESKNEKFPRSKKAMYYSICGHACELAGNSERAREAFTRAKKCDPTFATCDVNIARLDSCSKHE